MSVYPPVTDPSSSTVPGARANQPLTAPPSRAWIAPVLLLVIVGTLGGVFGGPTLGDHEAIVAQCGRNMRLSGDWVVPEFLGTPFFRKPPLPYWLVAASSYLFPADPVTGLPVTATSARFPSGLAALGTILLLWRLASRMFGPRTGLITAVISAGSLFFLLYSPNVTAEMLLTICCTWAYFHFWFAVTGRDRRRGHHLKLLRFRNLHIVMFYVAMGFGMLAKGPAPIVMTAVPLAVWWYTERPLRRLARGGIKNFGNAAVLFFRELLPRTIQAFTQLWLLPGLVVFALLFVPWMLAVAARYPHAWNLWDWQYWQRAQGKYEDTRVRGPFYYLPVVMGLTLPWLFILFEAALAPWLKRYTKQRRGLLYAGLWALIAVAAMSMMQFKKPYYIAPAIPALLLLMSVVAERFYSWIVPRGPTTLWLIPGRTSLAISNPRRLAWTILGALAIGALAAVIGAGIWLRKEMPDVASGLTIIAAFVAIMLIVASAGYIAGRGWTALALTSLTSITAFLSVWHIYGQAIDNNSKVAGLAHALDKAGIPADANVLWADARPDARLGFYFNRKSTYMIKPEEIVTRMVDRTQSKMELQEFALTRADELMKSPQPVYLILDRRHYDGWRHYMSNMGHIIAEIPDDDKDAKSRDWLVISNIKPPVGR